MFVMLVILVTHYHYLLIAGQLSVVFTLQMMYVKGTS